MTVKKTLVPLEEALAIAGSGWYTRCVWLVSGLVNFAGFTNVQAMSIVVTAAGCDLHITPYQQGILTSMGYFGMIFSSHLCGILADSFGRKRLIIISSAITGLVTVLSSLAPNVEVLMLAFFINGFLVGGVFTPGYVYASEFCPTATRATGLIVVASCGSLTNAFLPCLAWLVLPIEIHYPLYSGVAFNSWRLFLVILSLPLFLCATLISYLPETPKFLLNQGKDEETMEVLKSIYAVNMKKMKEDFPVYSICLDSMDQDSQKGKQEKPGCREYLQDIIQQTVVLFSAKYLFYTLLSCASILVVVGVYNIMILWTPEQVRQLVLYADSHPSYNVSLCNVMSRVATNSSESERECAVNYLAYVPSVGIGLLQFLFFYLVNFIVSIVGPKALTVTFSVLSGLASILLIFADMFYVTVFCLGTILVLLITMFPVCLSVVVSYFPTTLRSNATSIVMLFGRIFSVVGTQLLGAVFQSNCEMAYGVISAFLIGHVILCIFMPMKT